MDTEELLNVLDDDHVAYSERKTLSIGLTKDGGKLQAWAHVHFKNGEVETDDLAEKIHQVYHNSADRLAAFSRAIRLVEKFKAEFIDVN